MKTLKKEYRLEEAERLILQKALRFNYDNPRVVRETLYFVDQIWSMKRDEARTLEVEDVYITVTCTSRPNGYDELLKNSKVQMRSLLS